MIVIDGITKIYNNQKLNQVKALNNVSLAISEGEMVSIIGRSGAGKSTLLHIIACIERFDSGKLIIDGIDISTLNDTKLSDFRNSKIGIIMQNFSLINSETALYNVMLPLFFSNRPMRTFRECAHNLLYKLGIDDLSCRKINEMSGGQKQRVSIARALINNPDLLVADEPTGSLDSQTANDIMMQLKQLNNDGKTIIIVTHDKDVAAYCNRSIVLDDGEILGPGANALSSYK